MTFILFSITCVKNIHYIQPQNISLIFRVWSLALGPSLALCYVSNSALPHHRVVVDAGSCHLCNPTTLLLCCFNFYNLALNPVLR